MDTIKITHNGITKEYFCSEAEPRYRSHINGLQCICPESWVAMSISPVDESDLNLVAWYCNDDEKELDDIDYSRPDDIEFEW